jgi:hypothetical protein
MSLPDSDQVCEDIRSAPLSSTHLSISTLEDDVEFPCSVRPPSVDLTKELSKTSSSPENPPLSSPFKQIQSLYTLNHSTSPTNQTDEDHPEVISPTKKASNPFLSPPSSREQSLFSTPKTPPLPSLPTMNDTSSSNQAFRLPSKKKGRESPFSSKDLIAWPSSDVECATRAPSKVKEKKSSASIDPISVSSRSISRDWIRQISMSSYRKPLHDDEQDIQEVFSFCFPKEFLIAIGLISSLFLIVGLFFVGSDDTKDFYDFESQQLETTPMSISHPPSNVPSNTKSTVSPMNPPSPPPLSSPHSTVCAPTPPPPPPPPSPPPLEQRKHISWLLRQGIDFEIILPLPYEKHRKYIDICEDDRDCVMPPRSDDDEADSNWRGFRKAP